MSAAAGQWAPLTTLKALAASAPGRACGLEGVTAVSFGPDENPMAAGSCARPGAAGVFTDAGGTWRSAGLTLPAGGRVRVLGLTALAGRQRGAAGGVPSRREQPARGVVGRDALDGVGPGDGGRRAGARVRARRERLAAAGRRAGRDHRRGGGEHLAGAAARAGRAPRSSRRGTAAPGTGGSYDALAVAGSRLTVWRLAQGAWAKVQQITVPIQYGSSG